MKEDKDKNTKLTDREDAHLGTRDWGKTPAGAGLQHPQGKDTNSENPVRDEKRADMNGNKGHFESEKLEETGRTSAIPGAESKDDVGEAASGAGLGGNKGQGTRSRKNLS